jgi:hypothetical protein
MVALMLALSCAKGQESADSSLDTGCESEGDIDKVRYLLAAETCTWTVDTCAAYSFENWVDCRLWLTYQLESPVDAGQCIDWCAARTWHQTVVDSSCESAPQIDEIPEDWPVDLVTQFFYECESPNYEPSGL